MIKAPGSITVHYCKVTGLGMKGKYRKTDLPKLLSLVYHDWNDDKARKVVEREQLVVQELLEVLEGEPAKVQKCTVLLLCY